MNDAEFISQLLIKAFETNKELTQEEAKEILLKRDKVLYPGTYQGVTPILKSLARQKLLKVSAIKTQEGNALLITAKTPGGFKVTTEIRRILMRHNFEARRCVTETPTRDFTEDIAKSFFEEDVLVSEPLVSNDKLTVINVISELEEATETADIATRKAVARATELIRLLTEDLALNLGDKSDD